MRLSVNGFCWNYSAYMFLHPYVFYKKNAMFEVRYLGLSEGRRKKLSQEKEKDEAFSQRDWSNVIEILSGPGVKEVAPTR